MYQVTPVKLFMGIIYRDEPVRTDVKEFMMRRWGIIDYESDSLPYTDEKIGEEMGTPLFRFFVSFNRLIDPGEIALIKMACMGLEERFRYQGKRRANLDPGYVESHKVILSSSQPSPAKVYHSAGIYLDTTLLFVKEKCQSLPWSYPEFKNHFYDECFLAIRGLYKEGLKTHQAPQTPSVSPLSR